MRARIIIGSIIGFLVIWVIVLVLNTSGSNCSRSKEDAPIANQPELKLIGNYETDYGHLQVYTCGKDTLYISKTDPNKIEAYIAVK